LAPLGKRIVNKESAMAVRIRRANAQLDFQNGRGKLDLKRKLGWINSREVPGTLNCSCVK
jgi:hypothetical protein